ncbi:dephospho-CoA kinase [Streptobacillus moniliformis]|uniref:Dephospho-CoA kinase n=1 Tax=Streptobacillus moniliformis (strain ATCC 14647 / DSM 12112 / NCTC 10651 / 9901) TaxID=519441 RepID=D1AWT2_STRM9|nr:dephospho-CoA kinase [Streptobacillus moniliformis]ACZ00758.1 dephospho-CoA kinase [Streptobacillus moniliformis DSM 12112]AVL42847.1 dephospho-CoA kinase [Streptobacillus moniliformis]QXW65509.1 dephospho-CoA kinase [Streptobacillus moniliformis]SQA14112.1 Dephospho-CoA kinase [Streptobacillus moniliformis]
MIVGLTGSIGVGKSKIFDFIKTIMKDEAEYIDADLITAKLYNIETVKKELYSMFGTCDKSEISKIVFSDSSKLTLLNNYMHKIIIRKLKDEIENCDKKYMFLDVPLIYELNLQYLFDKIIVVYAPKNIQIERIMKRNNLTYEEAISRIEKQIDIEIKKEKADYIIDNSSDIEVGYVNTLDVLMKLRKEETYGNKEC